MKINVVPLVVRHPRFLLIFVLEHNDHVVISPFTEYV